MMQSKELCHPSEGALYEVLIESKQDMQAE
jgi:hypothetical protein